MDSNQLSVLRKIIYAVETGGQIYGNARYDDFTEAYTNSSIEYAITIGAGAWYATEALKLLRNIYAKDQSLFTESLLYDMNNKNWNNYAINKDSKNAKAIVKIISSEIGKKCQDDLMDEQLMVYCNHANQLGITDPDAQALAANWEHQGSINAVKRILAKTKKPYNLDNLYAACCTDTEPNQVGSYRQRQRLVYQWIKQYLPVLAPAEYVDDGLVGAEYVEDPVLAPAEYVDEPTLAPAEYYVINPGTSAEDILNIMRSWIGLNQFDGSHMQIVNLYNNHLPRARGYALTPYDSWCDCTVSAAFIKANAVDLIGGTECGVEEHVKLFTKKGIWIEDGTITPIPGDIICFNWDKSSQPNDGFSDHIGIVEYVENGIIHTIEGNASGRVQRRTYAVGHGNIRGFARPKYGSDSSTTLVQEPVAVPKAVDGVYNGSSGDGVKAVQTMLIACGYNCGRYGADGEFGTDTYKALVKFQQDSGLAATGVYDAATKEALKKAFGETTAPTDWIIENIFPCSMYTIKDPYSYLREGPAKNKDIICKLKLGTKVRALKSHINKAGNLWYKVSYNGIKGWIVGTSLSVIRP